MCVGPGIATGAIGWWLCPWVSRNFELRSLARVAGRFGSVQVIRSVRVMVSRGISATAPVHSAGPAFSALASVRASMRAFVPFTVHAAVNKPAAAAALFAAV